MNVGLGVQWRSGAPNPKSNFYLHLAGREELKESRVLHAGGGVVPTRRPLSSPVADGFLVIGDAALTCNPLHGGGIGPAMLSAKIASEVITRALSEGDCTRERLWPYPLEYFKRYGSKQAALDLFRMFLQDLSDDEIEFGMSKRLVDEGEVSGIGYTGDLELSLAQKALRALRGISRPRFLMRLSRVAKYMRMFKEHYLNYPEDPSGFEAWLNKTNSILNGFVKEVKLRKA